ncbi:MAG: hypothetical protein ABJ263_17085 [Tateyamaria sp.]
MALHSGAFLTALRVFRKFEKNFLANHGVAHILQKPLIIWALPHALVREGKQWGAVAATCALSVP